MRFCLYHLALLLVGCSEAPRVGPPELLDVLEVDRALALCGPNRGPAPCEVTDSLRRYFVAFDSSGVVCHYTEWRMVPLTIWDSSFRAMLNTFRSRLGESQLLGTRFHQWSERDFTIVLTNQRADYEPPSPEDSLGAVIMGFSIPQSPDCPRG